MAGPPGLAYTAVGMHRALDSAIGLPRSSTSALRMLVFVMPPEVSSNFMMPLLASPCLSLSLHVRSRVSTACLSRRQMLAASTPVGRQPARDQSVHRHDAITHPASR